jgi:hypothetical protein
VLQVHTINDEQVNWLLFVKQEMDIDRWDKAFCGGMLDHREGSGTFLVKDELASSDTIKDQTEKPSLLILGVLQTRVCLITTWSSCWIAGALF